MSGMPPSSAREGRWPLPFLVAAVLVGFASNSLLCRAALGPGLAGAASFTAVRLGSGFAMLVVLVGAQEGAPWPRPRLRPSLCLAGYALGFSIAYRHLSAGTGALLLFGAVQVTMLAAARLKGEAFGPRKWLGAALAFAGLLVLTLPRADRPPLLAALSMAGAGAAWGFYSLIGRGSSSPLRDTCGNFGGAALMALPFLLLRDQRALSFRGLGFAVLSGTLASGATYALWYRVLPRLGAYRAAVAQLAVPVLTAAAGAVLLAEAPGLAWFIAAALTLGGVALASKA